MKLTVRKAGWAGSLLLAVITLATPARAEERAAPLQVVSYDIRDLVDYRARPGTGSKPGPMTAAQVVKLVMEQSPRRWLGPAEQRWTVEIVNDHRLDIRTTAIGHAEIAEYLAAQRRWQDVDVACKSQLYAVDAGYFNKTLKPLLSDEQAGLRPRLIGADLARAITRNGVAVKPPSAITVHNQDEAAIFSLRQVHPYAVGGSEQVRIESDYSGVELTAHVRVSADRRSVELRLKQQARNYLGDRRRVIGFDINGNEQSIDVPDIAAVGSTTTTLVDDGERLLVPIHWRPTVAGKVHVLVLRAELILQAEQRYFLDARLRAVWNRAYGLIKLNRAAVTLERIPGVQELLIRWLDRAGQ